MIREAFLELRRVTVSGPIFQKETAHSRTKLKGIDVVPNTAFEACCVCCKIVVLQICTA